MYCNGVLKINKGCFIMEEILLQDLLQKILESKVFEEGKDLSFIGTVGTVRYTREELDFDVVIVTEKEVPIIQVVCREFFDDDISYTMNCDIYLDGDNGLFVATKYLTNIGISLDTAFDIMQIISNVTGNNVFLTYGSEIEYSIYPNV